MVKTPETYDKVAEFYDKKGAKAWASGKSDPETGHEFENARKHYDTADRARGSAARLRNETD